MSAPSSQQKDRVVLPEGIEDPQRYTVPAAIEAAMAARAEGQAVETHLGALLQNELERFGARPARVQHLLAVLEGIHAEQQVLALRTRLMAHPDVHVKSRAALIIARAGRSADWIGRQLLDPEPRVQANAIEGGWGLDSGEMRRVFAMAAGSNNHRVAANALVGLYLAGDPGCVPKLLNMAEDPREAFRVAARWAMGETGDARFIPILNAAFRTDEPACRAMTVRSLARLRRRLGAWESAGRLCGRVWEMAGPVEDGRRGMSLSLFCDAADAPVLQPLNAILHDGGALVTDYALHRMPNPDVLLVGFVMPRMVSTHEPWAEIMRQALAGCLAMKRDADLWWVGRYRTAASAAEDEKPAVLPDDAAIANHIRNNKGLLAAPAIIRKLAESIGRREEASPSPAAAVSVAAERMSRVSGARRLFVSMEPDDGAAALEPIRAIFRDAGIGHPALHLVFASDSADAKTCAGWREPAAEIISGPPDKLAEGVAVAYRALLNRYDLVWGPPAGAAPGSPLQLRLVHARGCGEICMAPGEKSGLFA